MTKAIIVGSGGQDGRLLYQLLEEQGYLLIGLDKDGTRTSQSSFQPTSVNICEFEDVVSLVRSFQPDEVYHLAAFHSSAEGEEIDVVDQWEQSYRVNAHSLLNFLESIRRSAPRAKLFYAASSHVFGAPQDVMQDETTPVNPITAYGIAKAAGMFLCRSYRERHEVYASVGILYNHESFYRSQEFLSAKIIHTAIQIKKSGLGRLIVGDLNAAADWGYAPDYVAAMQMILALPAPDDFVVATGERHTVQEFVEIVFQELRLDWQDYVEERTEILTRHSPEMIGIADKLRASTGWHPSVGFETMVRTLVAQALANQEQENRT